MKPFWVATLMLVSASALRAQGPQFFFEARYFLSGPSVWRGLTRISNATHSLESNSTLLIRKGFAVTAGGWTSRAFGPVNVRDFSDLGPDSSGFGEVQFRAEILRPFGPVTAGFGVMVHEYHGKQISQSRTSAQNTSELFIRVQADVRGVRPGYILYYDWRRIHGSYSELSLGIPIIALDLLGERLTAIRAAVDLSASAGFSTGQEVNPLLVTEPSYYADRGLTHWTVGLGGTLTIPADFPITLHGAGFLQFNHDAQTRLTSVGRSRDSKPWLVAGVRLGGAKMRSNSF